MWYTKYGDDMKNKKTIFKLITIILLVIILTTCFIYFYNRNEQYKRDKEKLINDINNSYSKYVKTTKETSLYDCNRKIIGNINKDVRIELIDRKITDINDGYYELKQFKDHYIYYKDFEKTDSLKEHDDYYKNYVVFNLNVKTNKYTKFYDENFKYLYKVNAEYSMPIYIKEDDFYGVEYDNHLVYIKKSDDIDVIENHNTDVSNAKSIPVLLYHFFHTHNDYENLRTVISIRIDKFENQIKYLSDNDYMALRLSDLEKYIDGKVQIKEDSVVLTIDDGNSTTYSLAQPILEKYKINATSFIVTSWDNNPLSHRSEYLEVHSHTHNMHITGKCSGGQGGLFKCISYEDGIADLKKTREALDNTTYLAYPFGEYTSSSIKMLKGAGFTMAFTTAYGNATVGMDKYLIPRKYVYNEYSLNTFKNMIK